MLKLQNGQGGTGEDAETAILLNPDDAVPEAQLLLRAGAFVDGQNLGLERDGKRYLLLPAGVMERGDDYELVRFRMIRDSGENRGFLQAPGASPFPSQAPTSATYSGVTDCGIPDL